MNISQSQQAPPGANQTMQLTLIPAASVKDIRTTSDSSYSQSLFCLVCYCLNICFCPSEKSDCDSWIIPEFSLHSCMRQNGPVLRAPTSYRAEQWQQRWQGSRKSRQFSPTCMRFASWMRRWESAEPSVDLADLPELTQCFYAESGRIRVRKDWDKNSTHILTDLNVCFSDLKLSNTPRSVFVHAGGLDRLYALVLQHELQSVFVGLYVDRGDSPQQTDVCTGGSWLDIKMSPEVSGTAPWVTQQDKVRSFHSLSLFF